MRLHQLNPVVESVIAGIIGLAIGAAIMLGYGYDPISAYISLFHGSFGSVYSWAESLANATPLILTALTFAVAMRGGLFNIGAEGQLYIGALAAGIRQSDSVALSASCSYRTIGCHASRYDLESPGCSAQAGPWRS